MEGAHLPSPFHEPSRLRVADPRSGPRLCEAQRFMVPMRDRKVVEALHEPRGTSNIEHPTQNIEWQRESLLISAFGVRCWAFDVFPHRTFWSAGGFPRGRGKLRPWRARSSPHRFHAHLRKISVAFAPPKPNELVKAYSRFADVGFRTTGN